MLTRSQQAGYKHFIMFLTFSKKKKKRWLADCRATTAVFQPPDLFQVFLKNISCTIAAAGCYYSPSLHVGTFLPFDFSRHEIAKKEMQCDFIDDDAVKLNFLNFQHMKASQLHQCFLLHI